MKAQLPRREPESLARWQEMDLYGLIRQERAGGPRFVLHDGPPYANGDIHIGHALNKVLKDLIVRYKTMRGFDAPYVPGWDCHGMPIEHQLFKELKKTKRDIAQMDFREQARAYAQRYVDIQREQFKRLGVLGDWAKPYLTMGQDYELTILRIFRELVEAGYVYRGKKPVYWCATCETALAEAEVEYEDRADASIYVKFPVTAPPPNRRQLFQQPVAVVAWTTTPWTLPANVALCFHPDAKYAVLDTSPRLLVAADLARSFTALLNTANVTQLGELTGKELEGMKCEAPFGSRESVAVSDEGVSLSDGTGVVHIAPGHGHEDYRIGQRNKLETLSPVDHQGKFTKEVPQFAGQSVFAANPKIVADLKQRGLLLKEEPITHAYPHCWRCKEPVIFRATPQWFLSVERQDLRRRLLDAAKTVTWIPTAGLARICGMLETRPDWCLSRQRYWGTPIPVLHCTTCDQPLDDPKVIKWIEEALAVKGIDAWFSASPQELVPGAACPRGKNHVLRKETDILDVWFDSGVSHEAVLRGRGWWPAQLYLEGSDQHRGWFQVSLIPAVALSGVPPYEQVLTHGFVMDGQGRKMSKSLGNVVAPQDVMERYGADILRLWVASCDYREDVRISDDILAQVAESYRKIRNTFRYLLANLYDFDPGRDRIRPEDCDELDRWALHRTRQVLEAASAAYEACQFHEVARVIYQYCVVDLSAFYLDALKDRLYTEGSSTKPRRCAQTVLYDILGTLVRALAPILALTTDEVWQLMRKHGWVSEPSVHMSRWPEGPSSRLDPDGEARWATVLSMRDVVMKALEDERGRGLIGSPLEARVTLLVRDLKLRHWCEAHRAVLAEALVVSGVEVQADGIEPSGASHDPAAELVAVRVERAPGQKCARCWKHLTSVGRDASHPSLCERCARVVTSQGG